MHRLPGTLLPLSLFLLAACGPGGGNGTASGSGTSPSDDPASAPAPEADLGTEYQKASYGIGFQMGSQLEPAGTRVDMDAFLAGLRAGRAGEEPALPRPELLAAVTSLTEVVQEEESRRLAAEADENVRKGSAFLRENAERDEVRVTESGLQYEVLEEGDGPSPGPQSRVSIEYRGTFIDGTLFDSSSSRNEPAEFDLSGVIPGFREGLQLMSVGGRYRFYIPPRLAYGTEGAGQLVGPNRTLIFTVELLDILQ